MSLVVPYVGEVVNLDSMLRLASPEAQILRLYANDVTPSASDVATTYVEASIPGYAAISLARSSWGAAGTSAGVTSASYPQQTFSFTGSGTVYGYYVVGATSGTLLWAELLFLGGQAFVGGDSLEITPRMQLA